MQQALDRNTLDRLITLGRRQGQLTTEDLRASLPIESMSAEEIALIVVHLEESGVAVELEESLLSQGSAPKPPATMGAEIIPFPRPAAKPRPKPKAVSLKAEVPLQAEVPPLQMPARPEAGPSRAIHWIVAAAGLLTLAVVGLVIFASVS
jgi:sigma-70-like protein